MYLNSVVRIMKPVKDTQNFLTLGLVFSIHNLGLSYLVVSKFVQLTIIIFLCVQIRLSAN